MLHGCCLPLPAPHACAQALAGASRGPRGAWRENWRTRALQGQPVGSIASGGEHSVAALRAGGAVSWGWGRYGNLGDGTRVDRTLPTQVPPGRKAPLNPRP